MINQQLISKLKNVMSEVAALAIEKEELIEYLVLAMLSRMNIFLIGLPGNNKSDTILNLVNRIDGAKRFEAQLHEQFNAEELFGVLDITELAKGYKRIDTTNMLPEADIVVLEETFKARSVLNSLLKAMNEREYTNYGIKYNIPAFTFIGASNEIPDTRDPEERVFAALIDRFEIKYRVEYMKEKANRMKALNVVMERKRQKFLNNNNMINNTITKSELEEMQREVLSVNVPDAILDVIDNIVLKLREKNIMVTDRRYLNCTTFLQAVAYLNGRDTVELNDLAYLKNYFWDMPSDAETVSEIVDKNIVNPMKEKILSTMAIAFELEKDNNAAIQKGIDDKEKLSRCKKFRKEMVRIYDMLISYGNECKSDADKDAYDRAMFDIEGINERISQVYGFSYISLKELKAMFN